MSKTINNYMTADTEGDFVVLLTGMRINKLWKFWKWLPVFVTMPRMNQELMKHPELGLLHYRNQIGFRSMMVVQYWESWEKLHAWATDPTRRHLPAWLKMNKNVGLNGDVGTWHETYLVKERKDFECLYVNMPPHGLGKAMGVVEARGAKRTAKGRLGQKASPIPTPPPVKEPVTAREASPTFVARDSQPR
jgi:hypothetical protein